MKKIYFSLAILAMMTISCDKNLNSSQDDLTYSDMEITEFTYSDIPASGGTINPNISYRYSVTDQNGRTTEKKDGATLAFKCNNGRYVLDKETGQITAPPNTDTEPIVFTVDIEASMQLATSHKTITVRQTGVNDDLIESKIEQLPISLAPHTCVYMMPTVDFPYKFGCTREYEYVTTRTDGFVDRDYMDQYCGPTKTAVRVGKDYEYVSTKGVSINISGGDLVKVNTYLSGKTDTTLIAKASFSSKVSYQFVANQFVENNQRIISTDEEVNRPKSTISENVWKIGAIGNAYYSTIKHVLYASVEDKVDSLVICQQTNYVTATREGYLTFYNHELYTQRDNWPNFEDYPVGCASPKWAKDQYGDYVAMEDTKDLHPDGNRYIDFYFHISFHRMEGGDNFLSGAQTRDYEVQNHNGVEDDWPWVRGGVTITATADVKLKDGTTTTVTHKYEWIQPEDMGELNGNKYKGRGEENMKSFTIYLPVVENAAEDFEWTIKFDFSMTENHKWYNFNLKTNSNFFDYNWTFNTYKFKDCLSTVKEYEEAKKISGFFNSSVCNKKCQADIIDGVEQ